MSEAVRDQYADFLSEAPIFANLSEEEVSLLGKYLHLSRYQFGQTIVAQGARCEGLYLIFSGSVRLFVLENGKEVSMGLRKAGEIFAEVNILRDTPLEYTARATSECEILMIPRAVLADLWVRNPRIEQYMSRYAAVKATGGLVGRLFDLKVDSDKKEFESMIETIGIKRIDAGQVVLRQDTFEDRRLYVIRHGRVRVVRQEGEREFQIALLEKGETFGEQALLFSDNQPATVIADSNSTFLVIPDTTVKAILDYQPGLRAGFEERIRAFEQELERQRKLVSQKAGRWRFSPVARPGVGEKILDRFPLVEQEEEMDCGAACLAMVCRYYGIQSTMEQLRDFADVDCHGATLESLAVAGERLGFVARGVSATFTELIDFELPMIVHWQGFHYMVVYGVSRNQVHVADPALGFRSMTRSEFEKGWEGTCLLLERDARHVPSKQHERSRPGTSKFLQALRPWFGCLMGIAVFSGLLVLVPPLLIMAILDGVKSIASTAMPSFLVIAFLFLSVSAALVNLIRDLFLGTLKHGVIRDLTSNFIQQILYQPLDFFERRSVSDLLARYADHTRFWNFFAERGLALLVSIWILAFSWIALIYFHAGLASSYIAIHLLVLVILRYTTRLKLGGLAETSFDESKGLSDMFEGIESLKSRGAEYWMRCRWESSTSARNEAARKNFQQASFLKFSTRIVQGIALTFLIWKGFELYRERSLSGGEFVAVFLFATGSLRAFGDLVCGWLEWQSVKSAMQRLLAIHRLIPEQSTEQAAQNIILPELTGRFCIKNLYFRFQKNSPYIIEGLNCEIEAERWTSFVGPAGSGKSTLSKLLMGFYAIHEGSIEVDGYPLGLLEKGSYRRQIGYLTKKPFLIDGTLVDNVALGIRAPQRKRVVDVCRLAGLGERINELPGGYDCPVSELDTAEPNDWAPRLAVAGALYRDPSVLIFDQALSMLDLQAESDILNRIRKTYPHITMITFSERVNPQLEPDQVLMLYKGRIVESGSPADLRKTNGLFVQLLAGSDSKP